MNDHVNICKSSHLSASSQPRRFFFCNFIFIFIFYLTMSKLCPVCSSLTIEADQISEIRSYIENSIISPGSPISRTCILRKDFFQTVQDLAQSAVGNDGSKKCHLCVLLLRSLQLARQTSQAELLPGPLDLHLTYQKNALSLHAICDGVRGMPLRVDIDAGKTHIHVCFMAHLFSLLTTIQMKHVEELK